jgi:hypothetical protein
VKRPEFLGKGISFLDIRTIFWTDAILTEGQYFVDLRIFWEAQIIIWKAAEFVW